MLYRLNIGHAHVIMDKKPFMAILLINITGADQDHFVLGGGGGGQTDFPTQNPLVGSMKKKIQCTCMFM